MADIENFQSKKRKLSSNMEETNSTLGVPHQISEKALDNKALNLFSRQNAALGAETTAKLTKMRVLIYGARGVGVETCKNLALQGAGSITIVDSSLTEPKDLGVNFFLHKSDIGKPRGPIVAEKLKELNPLCVVKSAPNLESVRLESFTALVITQFLPLQKLLELNQFCREHHISFFYSYIGGITASVFVDHGSNHIVNDFDGERPVQKLITDIVQISDTECLIRYETPEGQQAIALNKGFFEVTEVVGIDSINGTILAVNRDYKDPVKTVRVEHQTINPEKYIAGGLLTEKKVPSKYPMESLASKLKNPGEVFADPPTLVSTDLLNFGSELQQHVAFYSIHQFASKYSHFPRLFNEEDYINVLEIAKELINEKAIEIPDFELNEDMFKKFVAHSSIELQPIAAFVGGVLAQEVVKCTGKFTPIPGFLHFASLETIPDEDKKPLKDDCLPKNDRLDELAGFFGWSFIEKLKNLKYFMVGCGALGCEFIKNFALNGICCGPSGKLIVTDADRIELSNLSRQFLFREHNVGQPKSRAASVMGKLMNEDFNVEALEAFVGPKTEDLFDDSFWMGLNGVCNALDNMEARLYVDRQCVKYEKSLLESGTMGTSGNVDTVCPFKTRTYAEGGNAAEGGGVPMCTLRNFPHLTDHCIEWSRDQFELLFVKLGKSYEAYVSNPSDFENKMYDKAGSEAGAAFFDIRSLISFAKFVQNPSIGQAAQLAYDIFHYLFRDRILDLTLAFPKDFRMIDPVTKQDKGPFWGEKKRYPTVLLFNPNDEYHCDFLLASTLLFSVMVGLIPPKKEGDDEWLKDYRHRNWIQDLAQGLSVPTYFQAPVNTEGLDMSDAPVETPTSAKELVQGLLQELNSISSSNPTTNTLNLEPIDFEKDDDLNFHIQFITSTANLRCDNYSIKRTDFHSCKVIAGRIIPAIATTTATVCGLVILELFKLVLEKPTDAYMNRFIGLSRYTFTSFTAEAPNKFVTSTTKVIPDAQEVLPAEAYDEKGQVLPAYHREEVHRVYPEGHTVWDKIVVNGKLTLQEFVQVLKNEHGITLTTWDFIYGYKTIFDENEKKKIKKGVTTPVYPPKPVLDYSLLPSLDLTLAQANMQLMKTPAAKPMQAYLNIWRECKATGKLPSPAENNIASDNKTIISTNTLYEILEKMSNLGDENLENGSIESKTVSHLDKRIFVVIPNDETPFCHHLETGDEIQHMAALKVLLK